MLNPNVLKTGLLGNAFLFTDSDVETAQEINRLIDFIQQGGATPSYADAQLLLKVKINLPGPNDYLCCVLCMLAVFCAVLPHKHPLVAFLKEHYGYMKVYNPAHPCCGAARAQRGVPPPMVVPEDHHPG